MPHRHHALKQKKRYGAAMRYKDRLLRQISWCLVVSVLLFLEDATGVQAQQQAQNPAQNAATAQTDQQQSADTTKSAAATNEAEASYPDAPVAQTSPTSNAQSSSAQTPPADDQNKDVRPLGTAAAPSAQPSGVTGSRPAGAVIAPGKQRRSHAILISVALIAGAAIAVGTVAALSHGSPSRP